MSDDKTTDAETRLRDVVRAARALLDCYNYHDMPEGVSRAWQALSDECLRSGVPCNG